MAQFKKPEKALLLMAVMHSSKASLDRAMAELIKKFGPVSTQSKEFDFTKFTQYYNPEMGKKQIKKYVVFEKLIDRSKLADIRLFTQKLEEKLSKNKKRTVNIDPGYITKEAVILGTLKERAHKIYLGKGVFADLQALFGKNELRTFDYTFADLKENAEFFMHVRKDFLLKR
ncbi:MAG: DUF4416 family protein [Candidatus Woesearchaeota archaeon]|nr:DUF4416 family protein [Candidatus Woesearchaeota archaeon]